MTRLDWESNRKNKMPKEYGWDWWPPLASFREDPPKTREQPSQKRSTTNLRYFIRPKAISIEKPSPDGFLASIDAHLQLLENIPSFKQSTDYPIGVLLSLFELMKLFERLHGSTSNHQTIIHARRWIENNQATLLYCECVQQVSLFAERTRAGNYAPLSRAVSLIAGRKIPINKRAEYAALINQFPDNSNASLTEKLCRRFLLQVSKQVDILTARQTELREKENHRSQGSSNSTPMTDDAHSPKTPAPLP